MVDAFSPLVWNVPIVNPDGTPTPQFIVLLQEALDAVDASGGDIAALKDAPFVMMGASAETPNERVLVAGTAIDITDGGPGSTATVLLENTAVTPGTYGDDVTVSQVTVDAQGRITAAVDVPIDFPSSPTALEVEDNGAPIVSTDTVNFLAPLSAVDNGGVADISLDSTAVTPGSYGSSTQVGAFTVDPKGRLTAASNISVSFAGYVPDTRTLTAGAGLTGGGDLSANRTFDIGAGTGITVNANDVAIANTAVTPAAYGSAAQVGTFTVDQQGRLTVAGNTTIALNASAITAGTLAAARGGTGVSNTGTITLGGNLVTSGAFDLTLTQTATTNVTLPTTGTLATLAGSETLTNKTLTAPKITSFTTGSVLFVGASAVVAQDNSGLFYDVSTAFFGIGVGGTPLRPLHVKSNNTVITMAAFENGSATNGALTALSFRNTSTGAGGTSFLDMAGFEATEITSNHATFDSSLKFYARVGATYHDFGLGSGGNIEYDSSIVLDVNRLFRLRSYTVAALPAAGTAGRLAMVSDALAPGFLTIVVGGGAVKTPVFDNGANWVAF